MFRSLFNLFSPAPRSRVKNQPRLQLETLEDRMTPSCVVFTSNAGTTLNIVGDNADNDVAIVQNDNLNTLSVMCDGVPHSFSSTGITKINVDLKGGNDDFWYGLANGTNFKFAKQVDLKLGADNDTATFDMWQGIGVPCTVGSNLNIALDAGTGDDEVDADFGGKRGGILTFQANMNEGNDICRARMWGDLGAGAIVLFDLQGGIGNDTLSTWNTYDNAVSSYGSIDIGAGCEFSISLKGGAGQDNLYLTYAGKVNGHLHIIVDGGADTDMLSACKADGGGIYVQPGSTGHVDAKFLGGAGDDEIKLEVLDNSGGSALVSALGDGGIGIDHLSRSLNVSSLNNEWVTNL